MGMIPQDPPPWFHTEKQVAYYKKTRAHMDAMQKARERRFLWLIIAGIIIFCAAVFFIASPAHSEPTRYEQELTDYLSDYLEIYPERKAAALKYIPVVIEASVYERIDPMLIATIISFESSWRAGVVSKSSLKERGLMQVHGVAAKGFNLETVESQVKAGAKHLGLCLDKCEGDVGKALGCYSTRGFCNDTLSIVKRRLKAYKANVKKYRRVRR